MTNASDQPPIKAISDLNFIPEPPPTIETWEEWKELNCGPGDAFNYAVATFNMLTKLEKVVLLEDLAQMKEEVTKLYTQQYEFFHHAWHNTP